MSDTKPSRSLPVLDSLDLDGKRVLIRVDLNVPMRDGEVADAARIERSAETILEVIGKGGKAILLSHFGRPKGKPSPEASLEAVVPALSRALKLPVAFAGDCVGEAASQAIASMSEGGVLLLENTRFHPGEEKNDSDFSEALAANGDLYINDAFSASHRAHASTHGLARLLPRAAGRAMQKELNALEAGLSHPTRPLMAIVGGAKVSTKINLLENLVGKTDILAIGGAMANTFLAARGIEVGKSLCERDFLDEAKRIEEKAKAQGCELLLPVDAVTARKFESGAESESFAIDSIPSDSLILDAGPLTVARLAEAMERSATLIWNGPLGAFELPPFDSATNQAAAHAARLTREGKLFSVAGGGDTLAALNRSGAAEDFSCVSTAGGAFLEWMEGKSLPAIEALRD